MKNAEVSVSDYLAVIFIGAGASWYRGKDKAEVLRNVGRQLVDDWSHLYKLAGEPCKVNLFDVSDFDEVNIGYDGVRVDDKPIPVLEVAEIVLPRKR